MKSTKVIKDAETKYVPASKSGGGCVPGSTCVLRACFLNTAVSLSPAFPLSTHQREPIPPPPSHPRSPVVDGGFPRPIVSLYLLSSVDPVARQSVAGYIGMYVPRVSRLLDGFGFGLQTHPAAQICSASAQKSPEMGRPCDSNLGNNQNCSGHHGKNLK